jgi:hypothetical protein
MLNASSKKSQTRKCKADQKQEHQDFEAHVFLLSFSRLRGTTTLDEKSIAANRGTL